MSDCSGRIPGHTTRAPPVGFELETNSFQFYAVANLDKTSLKYMTSSKKLYETRLRKMCHAGAFWINSHPTMKMHTTVSSKEIQKARRLAKRTRSAVACARCKASKVKCNDYRPCKQCVENLNSCDNGTFRYSTKQEIAQLGKTLDTIDISRDHPVSARRAKLKIIRRKSRSSHRNSTYLQLQDQ